ncbi:MAG: DUF4340 domain-containing protein [Leptospiraceae bacterium]|nr:DUF4340 domain-containing protein [Leptospiraceae bacterium]
MNQFKDFIQNNKAFSITAFNLILLLLIIPFKDPFGFFVKSYDKAKPFFSVSKTDVSQIMVEKITDPKTKQTLTQENGNWKVATADKQTFQADEEKANQLVDSILKAKKFTVVTSSKEKATEYGFGEDGLKVEVFGKDKSSLGFLLIGSVSPKGSNTHVKWKDGNDIYLVEDNLKSVAGRGDGKYFINKKVVPTDIDMEVIEQVVLSYAKSDADGYIVLKDKGNWVMQKPKTGNIAKDDMNIVLPRLTGLNADDVVTDKAELDDLKTENNFQLQFSYKSKLGAPKEIKLACIGTDKDGSHYYIQKDGDNTVYKLSDYKLKSVLEFKPEFKKEKEGEKKEEDN